MIRLQAIDKYFNKGRRNELHVLDSIDLEFPARGLVMFLGDSGSGKTTLLNVIGGLDKADKGTITFDGEKIDKYRPAHFDRLRSSKIGYVFQQYYLLPHETVYQNIRMTLQMIGIEDEREIGQRINHLLELVNMLPFKHRKANQLSGGQQQRIAIVRALAKAPSVIIADEPTGNLDSKNTVEIMKILKAISEEKLVIMVTHEQDLAHHYGDTIIEIEDGRIAQSGKNEAEGVFEAATMQNIYLGDLEAKGKMESENATISIYSDNSVDTPLKARLIVKNKTLYLDIDEQSFKSVHRLTGQSETRVYDTTAKEHETMTEAPTTFDYATRFPIRTKRERPLFKLKHAADRALAKIKKSTRLSKLLYAGFAFGAAMFAFSLYTLANIIVIDESEFLEEPKYTFVVEDKERDTLEAFLSSFEDAPLQGYGLDPWTQDFRFGIPFFYQTRREINTRAGVFDIEHEQGSRLLRGRMPQAPGEIVIGRPLADDILQSSANRASGITSYEDLLDIVHHEGESILAESFRITGIVDTDVKAVYALSASVSFFLHDELAPLSFYDEHEGFTLESGANIQNAGEILLPTGLADAYDTGETYTIDGITYDVVGFYSLEGREAARLLVAEADLHAHYYAVSHEAGMTRHLYTDDPTALERYLDAAEEEYENLYQSRIEREREMRLGAVGGLMIFSAVALGATALSFFFIIRSSLMGRIYEIGVYRSLGVRRRDILKMFLIEVVILTSVSSLVGFSLMTYVLHLIQKEAAGILSLFEISFFTVGIGVLAIYALNLFFGLLPLYMLLRKTPARIMTAYDL